jgi:hypothetical protein
LVACTVSTFGLVIAGLTMGTWWALVGMSIAAMGFYGSFTPPAKLVRRRGGNDLLLKGRAVVVLVDILPGKEPRMPLQPVESPHPRPDLDVDRQF